MKHLLHLFIFPLLTLSFHPLDTLLSILMLGLTGYGIFLVRKTHKIPIVLLLLSLIMGFTMFLFMLYPILFHLIQLFKLRPSLSQVKGSKLGFSFQSNLGRINLDNPFRGIYIQGGAGSGKSKSLFEPIIAQAVQKNYTGILYDFKSPELTQKLLSAAENYESEVQHFFVDFREATKSHRINPLDTKYLTKTAHAFEFSKSLINNLLPETVAKQDFWGRNAQNILAGLIWYMRNQFPKYCTLPHVISLLLHSDVVMLLNKVKEDPVAGGMVVSLTQAMDRGAEKQVAGVLSTLQNALSTLNTPDVFWILSGNDLDLNLNDPNNPKFLSIGNDSSLAETYAPVVSLIITVASKMMNVSGRQQSVIMLDEAPTIYIPNFEQIPATGRSNRIATVFGAQDISQVNDKYGKEKAQVILSNLGNQFYGRTTNSNTSRMIKDVFGTHEVRKWSKNQGVSKPVKSLLGLSKSKSQGVSEQIKEQDKLRAEDITNLNSGQFYGVIAEGNHRELMGIQLKPFDSKPTSTLMHTRQVDEMQITRNYDRIIEETKFLFQHNQKVQPLNKKSRNKYLNLDL